MLNYLKCDNRKVIKKFEFFDFSLNYFLEK